MSADLSRILALGFEPPEKMIAALKEMQGEPDRLAEVLGGLVASAYAPDAKMDAIRDAGTAMLHAELSRRSITAASGLKAAVESLNRSTTRLTSVAIGVGIVGVLVTLAQLWLAIRGRP